MHKKEDEPVIKDARRMLEGRRNERVNGNRKKESEERIESKKRSKI